MYKITILLISLMSLNLFSMGTVPIFKTKQRNIFEVLHILEQEQLNRLHPHQKTAYLNRIIKNIDRIITQLPEEQRRIFEILHLSEQVHLSRLPFDEIIGYLNRIIEEQRKIFEILHISEQEQLSNLPFHIRIERLNNIIRDIRTTHHQLQQERPALRANINPRDISQVRRFNHNRATLQRRANELSDISNPNPARRTLNFD